jgi:hypothetical protein
MTSDMAITNESEPDWCMEAPTTLRLTTLVLPADSEDDYREEDRLVLVKERNGDNCLCVTTATMEEYRAARPFITRNEQAKLSDDPKNPPRLGSRRRYLATLVWLRQLFEDLQWTPTPDELRLINALDAYAARDCNDRR